MSRRVSGLNSSVNFCLSIAELRFDQIPNLVSAEPGAGHIANFCGRIFLGARIKRKLVDSDFDHALETALELAKSQDAVYLPGWYGPALEHILIALAAKYLW